ncbi:VWA domain-containing protein, partial [Hanstruepera flava]|uniref:VWA domain-containing protein n=1 Tax=Hanstruepera flava TaxID=2930218 RepID=UPI002027AF5A
MKRFTISLLKNLSEKKMLLFLALLFFSTQMQSQTFCPDDVGDNCNDCPNYSVTANPDLSVSCQGSINVILVIDESNSIGNANAEQDVENGVNAFLQELECTPVNVAVIEFGSVANYVVNSYTPVANVITGMNNYFDGIAYNGQTYNPDQGDLGGTNWQAGLMLADALAAPDLLLVFTDGVPTAWTPDTNNISSSYDFCGDGSDTEEAEIYNAVQVANQIKSEGTHMFILGVGGVNAGLMEDISDDDIYGSPSGQTIATADMYIDQGFNTLAECFASLANSLCPIAANVQGSTICDGDSNGTITINISNGVPAPYTITVNNGTPLVTSDNPVIITGLQSGNYDVKVEASGTCFGEGNYNIDVLSYPVTPDDSDTVQVCSGDTYTYEGQEYAAGSHD